MGQQVGVSMFLCVCSFSSLIEHMSNNACQRGTDSDARTIQKDTCHPTFSGPLSLSLALVPSVSEFFFFH